MTNCRLIDAHGVSLWFGLDGSVPHEIRRPTGRKVPPSAEDKHLCRMMGILAEDVDEERVFRLYVAESTQCGHSIAEYREVGA